jgi:hypothetical protein
MKISKTFRLSEEAVAVLDEQRNATEFIERLIIRGEPEITEDRVIRLIKMYASENFASGASPTNIKGNNDGTVSPVDLSMPAKVINDGWKEASPKKAVITPPCCFLPKQCDHDIWDMDSGQCINPKTGVVKEV